MTFFGCLGVLAISALFVGGTALVAWNGLGDQDQRDAELEPVAVAPPLDTGAELPVEIPPTPGRLVLDLAQGEFHLDRGEPGSGVRIRARYDAAIYVLEENWDAPPDSNWTYTLKFERTIGGMQALFRQLMGGSNEARLDITIAPDLPLDLLARVQEGGFEADLGGLWLRDVELRYAKGGFSIEVSEPTVEPVRRMSLRGGMGGVDARRLGNASPHILDVRVRMGGGSLDLGGAWQNDSEISLDVSMGGGDVNLPENVRVEFVDDMGPDILRDENDEGPLPVLRMKVRQKMGGIEFR